MHLCVSDIDFPLSTIFLLDFGTFVCFSFYLYLLNRYFILKCFKKRGSICLLKLIHQKGCSCAWYKNMLKIKTQNWICKSKCFFFLLILFYIINGYLLSFWCFKWTRNLSVKDQNCNVTILLSSRINILIISPL